MRIKEGVCEKVIEAIKFNIDWSSERYPEIECFSPLTDAGYVSGDLGGLVAALNMRVLESYGAYQVSYDDLKESVTVQDIVDTICEILSALAAEVDDA